MFSSLLDNAVQFPSPVQGIDTLRGPYIQGHVEIFHNNEWGSICDDNFDQNNNGAIVLCRMMGLEAGVYSSSYRQSSVTKSRRIWLDDVRCTGTETHINQCRHRGWGSHNCGHSEDVAIRCYGKSFLRCFIF